MGLIQYVKSINCEQEAYPAYEDFIVLPLFALFFPSVRFFLDRFVFEVLGFISFICFYDNFDWSFDFLLEFLKFLLF